MQRAATCLHARSRDEGGRVGHDDRPRIQIEQVDHLPPGRLVVWGEAEHETVFLVLRGAPMDEVLVEMQHLMQQAVDTGMWVRTWRDPDGADDVVGSERQAA